MGSQQPQRDVVILGSESQNAARRRPAPNTKHHVTPSTLQLRYPSPRNGLVTSCSSHDVPHRPLWRVASRAHSCGLPAWRFGRVEEWRQGTRAPRRLACGRSGGGSLCCMHVCAVYHHMLQLATLHHHCASAHLLSYSAHAKNTQSLLFVVTASQAQPCTSG